MITQLISDYRSQISEEIVEAQNEAEKKKAGSGPAPLSCLPLHQLSIFPGYSSNRLNGERFPEKSQKDSF
jgi:hypothetical protein